MFKHEELLLLANGNDQDRLLLKQYLSDPFYAFHPRPDRPKEYDEQSAFVNSTHRGIDVVIAGNAAGKTLAGCYKVAKITREVLPKFDLTKFMVISQNTNMTGSIWQEKLSRFIPEHMIQKVEWYNRGSESPKNVILVPAANGKRWMLCFRSYEMGRRAFQSISQCGGWFCDEQGFPTILHELDTRTREWFVPGGKMITCTPVEPDPWLETHYDNTMVNKKYPYYRFYRMNADCNNLINHDWLDNTPEDMRETRRIGSFMSFKGQVFKEWNAAVHMIKPFNEFTPMTNWHRIIDFGYSHLTACLLVAQVNDKLYVTKEWSAAGMLIKDKVDAINKLMPNRPRMQTWGDSEDAQQRAEFAKLGMPVQTMSKNVNRSIDLVRRRLMAKTLFVFDNCPDLVKGIKNYQWLPNEGREDKKDRPISKDDDHVAALRMICDALDSHNLAPWKACATPIAPVRQWSV